MTSDTPLTADTKVPEVQAPGSPAPGSPAKRRRPVTANQATFGVLLGVLVAALLSSASLVGLAERQPVGTVRDVALDSANAFHRVSSFLSLDRPARVFADALGKDEPEIDIQALIEAGRNQQVATANQEVPANPAEPTAPTDLPETDSPLSPTTSSPQATVPQTDDPPVADPPQPVPTAPATNPPASTPVSLPTAPRDLTTRPITADDPLKLWVGGDSLSLSLTVGFGRVVSPTLVDFTRDTQLSSGLTRKDFLDWPQRLARLLTEDRPEVLIIMFGGNDYQNVYFNQELLERTEQPWLDFYRTRVQEAMDLLNQPDLQVIWVGQPIMESDFFSAGMADLNEIYRSEAATRASITFFDTWNLFATPQGTYSDTIAGELVREIDGIHLNTTGGIRLAEAIWQQVAPAWGL